MSKRFWQGILLIGSCVLVLPAFVYARADDVRIEQPHNLSDKFALPNDQAEQRLKDRLKGLQYKELWEQLQKSGVKPETLEQWAKDNPEFLKNFKFDQLPADLKAKLKGREQEVEDKIKKFDPEDFKKFREEMDRKNAPANPLEPLPGQPKGKPNMPPQPGDDGNIQPPPNGPNGQPMMRPGMGEVSPPLNPNVKPEEQSTMQKSLIEWMGRWDKSLPRSPGMAKAMGELGKYFKEDDPSWQKMGRGWEGFKDRMTGLTGSAAKNVLPEKGIHWPDRLTPSWRPSFPSFDKPTLDKMPAPGGATGSGGASNWQFLLGIAGLIALGVALWKLLSRPTASLLGGGRAGWMLGPWPVRPADVRTREDLIRAFEYLSLLRLGPDARTWNHRTIADHLGSLPGRTTDVSYEYRDVAGQLATLYEQARYAPLSEPLPDGALAAARRDLSFLAGVHAA